MYDDVSIGRRTLKIYPAVKSLINLALIFCTFILIINETSDNSYGTFSNATIKEVASLSC